MYRGGGKKGRQSKISRRAQEMVLEAFELIGGVPALAAWGKANPEEFYTLIWARLLPKHIDATVEGSSEQQLVISAVSVANPEEALSALERLQDVSDAHWKAQEICDAGLEDEAAEVFAQRRLHSDGLGGNPAQESGAEGAEASGTPDAPGAEG